LSSNSFSDFTHRVTAQIAAIALCPASLQTIPFIMVSAGLLGNLARVVTLLRR